MSQAARPPSPATSALIGLVSAIVAILCWRPLGAEPSGAELRRSAPRAALPASTWRLLLAPALRTSVSTLLLCAVCVGGTFMVVTVAGIQEARRVAGASAPRLIAAMTAAFAVGQLVGPFTVTSLGSSAASGVALPHGVAATVLLLGLAAMALAPATAPAVRRSLEPGERT